MLYLAIFSIALVISFGAVLFVGAPYMPTLKGSCEQALDLLDLKPGQTLLELGSGDGAMLVAAARRGLKVEGYELNPFLLAVAWLRTRRYRRQVKLHLANFWKADFRKADGVYVFLLDRYMPSLDARLQAASVRPLKVVSHAFKIPGKEASAQNGAMFLYVYR